MSVVSTDHKNRRLGLRQVVLSGRPTVTRYTQKFGKMRNIQTVQWRSQYYTKKGFQV